MFFTVTPSCKLCGDASRKLNRCHAAIDWPRTSHRGGVGLRLLALCAAHPEFSTAKNFVMLHRRNHALGGERSGEFVSTYRFWDLAMEKAAATRSRRSAATGNRISQISRSRRWNIQISECLHQTIFRPLQHRPVFALFAVFFVSGIIHEWAINVPLYIVTGKKYFGCMMLYFLLQAIGILIEHKTRNRGVRIFLLWLFVSRRCSADGRTKRDASHSSALAGMSSKTRKASAT